jgi:hypothetical protein
MEKEQQHKHAMHSPEASDMDIGASFQPPAFSLNNGTETPPDEGQPANEAPQGTESEELRPEIIEQLETPLPDENESASDQMEVDDEMETDSTEMETGGSDSIQMKSSDAPIQMAHHTKKTKKKKKKNQFLSHNGFAVNFKSPTSKQGNYLRRFGKMNVLNQKEADRILRYIVLNKTGKFAPREVRDKLRGGFRINPTSGRFVNGNNNIVDYAKYNKTGFQFGNKNSGPDSKGNQEIDIPHSSLDQDVKHSVNYKNTKGEKVTISPNLVTGKLDKQWSQRSNGKSTNKSGNQMQSGEFLAYLAEKRKKLLAEKAKYCILADPNEYWALNTAIIDMSEMIAELSTQMAVDKFLPGATTHNSHTQGGKQGEFDQVHQNGSDYYAMECKGGGSSLGGRKNPNGPGKVQQGSGGYTSDLLNNYKNDNNQGIQTLGTNMENARGNKNLHYMHAKQTFDPNTNDITDHLSLKEFDI